MLVMVMKIKIRRKVRGRFAVIKDKKAKEGGKGNKDDKNVKWDILVILAVVLHQ